MPPHPLTNLEMQIIGMNQNLMMFIQETIYSNKAWGVCNKS